MSEEAAGFVKMAGPRSTSEAPEIGVGMLGAAFMGKAHTNAYKKIPYMIYPPPAIPKLVEIVALLKEEAAEAAKRYGYESYSTNWHELIDNKQVQLFDNVGSNDIHAEACIAAAKAGKHILCEKPLARSGEEAKAAWDAVEKANIKAMVGFNYRFVPAIRQAYELIKSGALGRIYHFRAVYLQEWIMPHYNMPMIWRLEKKVSGSGALGDLGAHIIDLGRHLVGEVKSVSAMTKTFIPERPTADGKMAKVEVDDAFVSCVEFENGAIGTVEASRFSAGRKNHNVFEINGEKGSIKFNLENMNEMDVFWIDDKPKETQGFHHVLVSEGYHPFWPNWWPHGHIIGWEHTFVHEITHLLDSIVNNKPIGPYGATFEDGYRTAVICDAILESARTKKQIDLKY